MYERDLYSGRAVLCDDLREGLAPLVGTYPEGQVFLLVDTHTRHLCLPHLLTAIPYLQTAHLLEVPSGDSNKTLSTAQELWTYLSEHGATRASLMLNLGGGMVSDLGGFVASTFKRGMDYVNLPTTLLGAVDAAIGGKTAVNFRGLKNEIGAFALPRAVVIHTDFFATLSRRELLSGFAEMVKHALLDGRTAWLEMLRYDLDTLDIGALRPLLTNSIAFKNRTVEKDPQERGLREMLNLGHTLGHAFESLSQTGSDPLPHGFAVMWGMVGALYLSHRLLGFPKDDLEALHSMAKTHYGRLALAREQYDTLVELMHHDKKNTSHAIRFTLLSEVGKPHTGRVVLHKELLECLDYLREG